MYNWIQQAQKSKWSKIQQAKFDEILKNQEDINEDEEVIDDELDELDILNNSSVNSTLKQSGGGKDETDCAEYDLLEDEPGDYDNTDENDDFSDELNLGEENTQHLYEDEKEHQFLKSHPQFQTHQIHCVDKIHNIPNFLGGPLPRCDQGDREFYCLTMLTLFKHWRSGKNLKSVNMTWDETFNQHKFTIRQEQLMKNFNLQYECLDARDDYSAKLKKDEAETVFFFPLWASSDVLKDLDKNTFAEFDDDSLLEMSTEESAYLDPTVKHLKKLEEMNQIENVVQNAGWLDECPQKIENINSKGINIQENMAGKQWNSVVKTAKDAILAEQGKHLPVNDEGIPLTSHN